MGALGGTISKLINIQFAKDADKLCGLFVSIEASTAVGLVDFGCRQITAQTTPSPTSGTLGTSNTSHGGKPMLVGYANALL